MSSSVLPPAGAVQSILIWHQGALGDLLLAGPALAALSRHYPQARFTGLGHPERWGLFAHTLPLAAVWDSGEATWAPLFTDSPLSRALLDRLAPFQLALIFSPRPHPSLLSRLAQAGIAAVLWVPSFPEGGHEPVAAWQAQHLGGLGLEVESRPFRLVLEENDFTEELMGLSGAGPWVAVAPGSGNPLKNWPLAHYYEVTRALAWQYKTRVVWLAGPAEEAWLPYLKPLTAAQGQLLLSHLPLARVAAVLGSCSLYLGGDSGLTHLAAVVGTPAVLALFGPTDPRIWAPPGEQVKILTGPCDSAPCAQGRQINCPAPQCLQNLSPQTVLEPAAALLPQA
ncbi:MAG: glycosyltransferase family 9 protein [Desulfobaccales bacterium]|nr:glycosyltransferase family 9 protein [Desulfobaccales bacterium]